jgi:tRNA nucleotidyltransferase (CCA-adding enzyme)
MERGVSQNAIAEFGHSRLSAAQRDVLSHALSVTNRRVHEGMRVGTVLVKTGRGFITGMAGVCEELLQLMSLDVMLLGVVHENAKGMSFLSLIGRCSARALMVDLNEVMGTWQGGGHRSAAAASLKLEEAEIAKASAEAEAVMERALSQVLAQIPKQSTAADIMTTSIFTCRPADTMEEARSLMLRVQKKATPVVDEAGMLMGMLKYRDVVKAAQANKGEQKVNAWMRRTQEITTVREATSFEELERVLIEDSVGRLPVVDGGGKLLGLVTRTDVLRQHNLYGSMNRRVR